MAGYMPDFPYAPIKAKHGLLGRNSFIETSEPRFLKCFRDDCVNIDWGKLDPPSGVKRDGNRIPAIPSISWSRPRLGSRPDAGLTESSQGHRQRAARIRTKLCRATQPENKPSE